jgi:hypothetical protein
MANPADLADYSAILQTVYTKIRKKAWSLLTPAVAGAKRGNPDSVTYAGNDLVFLVKTGRRGGFVASASGKLPEGLVAREKQGRLGIARLYMRAEVDGLADAVTANKKGAFLSSSKKVMEDILDQRKIEQSRIVHGDSLAIRGKVVGRTSATVVTVESPYGIASSGPGNLLFDVGDTLASLDAGSSNALLAKAKVSSITLSGDTATVTFASTIEGAGTIAVGDLLVSAVPAAVDSGDNSYGAEPHGFKSIVDVEAAFATFESINDARWLAQKLTSSAVDETILMKLLNTIRAKSGVDWMADPEEILLLTTTGIWQVYGESLLGMRRFNAPTMQLKGGFTGTMVANVPLVHDPWCPRGRLYAIHTPSTVFVDLMDWGARRFNDAPKWKQQADADAYEATFASYENYGATMRNSHGVISGITDTVRYDPIM